MRTRTRIGGQPTIPAYERAAYVDNRGGDASSYLATRQSPQEAVSIGEIWHIDVGSSDLTGQMRIASGAYGQAVTLGKGTGQIVIGLEQSARIASLDQVDGVMNTL